MYRTTLKSLSLFLLLLFTNPLATEPDSIAVLYPQAKPPYDKIFKKILQGFDSVGGNDVLLHPFNSGDQGSVQSWLDTHSFRSLVVLGQAGLNMVDQYYQLKPVKNKRIVVGAVRRFSDTQRLSFSGIAYEPAPGKLLKTLKDLAPKTQRVIVVYDRVKSVWLMDRARVAAQSMDIELITIETQDIKEAARQYRSLLEKENFKNTAIWLSQDAATVGNAVILPMLLKEAWNRNILLFSSALMHVQRGVLFSMYPDNFAMGKSIARLASVANKDAGGNIITPLEDLFLAVNRRTAQHLRLKITSKQWKTVDLILPAQR